MTRLVLDGLRKSFAGVPAVHHLDLETAEGEFISLLGPSGCGKTTTLRCVAGFEFPDSGRVLLDGHDETRVPPEKRDIGMVFQNYALFPHLTVAGNLAFGLEMRKVGRDEIRRRVEAVLATVQLAAMLDRYPRQLSGGQQQRVALARALVIEPRLLLLDEPLANLDAILRDEMRVFIRDLQKRVGITTLYVTHDQAEAMVMSDRVAVMLGGRLAQLGPPEEIYLRPASVEVARFIGRTNLVPATVLGSAPGSEPPDSVRVELDSPLGRLTGRAAALLADGAQMHVAIRPEAITFAAGGFSEIATAQGGDLLLRGRVERSYFHGASVEHVVRTAGGVELLVQTTHAARRAAGADVALRLPSDALWVVGQ